MTSRHYLTVVAAVAAVGAVSVLLTKRRTPKSRLVTDLSAVGTLERGNVTEDHIFDIIIIGGGTAGCVLASRLSENPAIRVLLLEAGQSGAALPFSVIPAGYGKILRTVHDYALWTVPQLGKPKSWPRAKLLGGCSSINAMMFHYGAPSDFDEWARVVGPGGSDWAFSKFKDYFLKFETFVPHPAFPVDESVRGKNGPVKIGFFGYFSNMAAKFLKACENIGIPINPDFNTPSGTLGVAKIMTYIDPKGRRVSTETAYLTPNVLGRPNLVVATGAHVTRILFDGKRAVAVEFCNGPDAPRYRASSTKEIVLAAGAVHSPHLLKLSGIGPAKELATHSIPLVHDLPGVGSHLMDHIVHGTVLRTKPGQSLNKFRADTFSLTQLVAILQWKYLGTGPLTSNVAEVAAFVRSDDRTLFPKADYPGQIEDSTSGPGAPDLELLACPFGYREHGMRAIPPGDSVTLAAALLRPTSTGSITLNSADPFDAPVIDPKYLSTQHDVDVLTRGVRLNSRISRTGPLSSIISFDDLEGFDHDLLEKSDQEIAAVVRDRVQTLYHPACSARMAPISDGGVLDPTLKVHGLTGLRVVDASSFPTLVSGHTAAPVIALAEKAADLIKACF